jgi:hypothetical protein
MTPAQGVEPDADDPLRAQQTGLAAGAPVRPVLAGVAALAAAGGPPPFERLSGCRGGRCARPMDQRRRSHRRNLRLLGVRPLAGTQRDDAGAASRDGPRPG